MTRREFPTAVRKEAFSRAAGYCEATGERYGMEPGQRCDAPLGYGFEYDHELPDWYGGEPTLENCVVVCRTCHKHATHRVDARNMAKARRSHAKHIGAKAPSRRKMRGGRHDTIKKKVTGEVVERD